MSRVVDRPGDYAPGLEVNMRLLREGGDLRIPAALPGVSASEPRERCVLLVHGYNNNDGEGAAAYFGFRGRQYAQFGGLAPRALEARFADAFWPGDADWWGPIDYLDFFFYPRAVGIARDDVPPVLAEAIGRIPALVELELVAHSLGCRVALETLERLRAQGRLPAVRRVCLMAAAVPCEFVEAGGRFEALLLALQSNNTEVRVLHSTGDGVLAYAFPAGQPAAGAGEASTRALGFEGPPPGMPGVGANVSGLRIADAAHGDYWGHGTNGASQAASWEAGRFLALGEPVREPGEAREVADARDIGEPREP